MTQPAATNRPRAHPEQRFEGSESVFDLARAAGQLMAEPTASHQGHRQKALFREGPLTVALFVFDRGGFLPEHVVDGPVVIHVLEGAVMVATPEGQHELAAGQLLRLAGGVSHNVTAEHPSRMLVTICRLGPNSGPAA